MVCATVTSRYDPNNLRNPAIVPHFISVDDNARAHRGSDGVNMTHMGQLSIMNELSLREPTGLSIIHPCDREHTPYLII